MESVQRRSRNWFRPAIIITGLALGCVVSAQEAPPDLSGVWLATARGGGGGMRARPRVTAEAREVMDRFDLLVDDPGYECSPSSLSRAWANPTPSEIEQLDDRVILRHEFMDIVRTIYLDAVSLPLDREPNVVGHSVGHYDGRSLIVETTDFAESYISTVIGIPQTGTLSAVERLTLGDDGSTMVVELTYSDPSTFEEPWVITRTYRRAPDIELLEFGCVLEDAGYEDFNP
ncbi:MAG: hypothetical protein ACR2QQ_11410 [Gammaproteobacteria bacterium]